MSLPFKKQKLHIDINPPKIGEKYNQLKMDRVEELMIKTDEKTIFLPRTIKMEDIDYNLNEYVNKKIDLTVKGVKVPVFYLENDRWGEFSKTWVYMDGDKNVPTPYIVVRRLPSKETGTRLGKKYRIPQPKTSKYLDVPILDDGQVINLRFKIPQPVNIDLNYEIKLFTKYRIHVNLMDETVFKLFASRQDYIFVKGHPMPVHLENSSEDNTITNANGDKYYVSTYNLKVLGYLQNEDEFEIVKTSRALRLNFLIKDQGELKAIDFNQKFHRPNLITSSISNIFTIKKEFEGIKLRFENINELFNNINLIKSKNIIYVEDASDDPNIKNGYAYYEYIGNMFGDIRDLRLISSENALNVLKISHYLWITTIMNEISFTIINAKENEIVQIINLYVGNVPQTSNYQITSTNVLNDTVVLNLGNNTLPIGTPVYVQYTTKDI